MIIIMRGFILFFHILLQTSVKILDYSPYYWRWQWHISRHFVSNDVNAMLWEKSDLKSSLSSPPNWFTRTSHIYHGDHIAYFKIQLISCLKMKKCWWEKVSIIFCSSLVYERDFSGAINIYSTITKNKRCTTKHN